jgi:hypothetical protein
MSSLIHDLQGKYDAYCSYLWKRKTAQLNSYVLHDFLAMFPEFTTPAMFDIICVEDYKIERICQGAGAYKLNRELYTVRDFWTWLVDNRHTRLNIFNGVKFIKDPQKQKRRLTHEEHSRLLAEMYEPKMRVFYAGLVRGETTILAAQTAGLSVSTTLRSFRAAAFRANLEWVKPSFVSRLTLELCRHRLAEEICDTLPAQPASLCSGLPSLQQAEELARAYQT